jgi:hypothetical protein
MKLKIKILLLIFCPFYISALNAQEIKRFNERIFTNADGTASVEWKIEPGEAKFLELPFGFKKNSPFICCGTPDDKIIIAEKNNVRYLEIGEEELKGKKEITLRFGISDFMNFNGAEKKEFGNISFKNRFVNTSANRIKEFKSEIILPEGYVVTSVDETTPKVSSSKPDSPFEVISVNNRHGVAIKNSNMKIGDNAAITFKAKKESKSPVFLAVMLLAGAAYLFFYRDVLKAPVNGMAKKTGG